MTDTPAGAAPLRERAGEPEITRCADSFHFDTLIAEALRRAAVEEFPSGFGVTQLTSAELAAMLAVKLRARLTDARAAAPTDHRHDSDGPFGLCDECGHSPDDRAAATSAEPDAADFLRRVADTEEKRFTESGYYIPNGVPAKLRRVADWIERASPAPQVAALSERIAELEEELRNQTHRGDSLAKLHELSESLRATNASQVASLSAALEEARFAIAQAADSENTLIATGAQLIQQQLAALPSGDATR